MTIRIIAMPSDDVQALRNGGPDANGHMPEHHVSPGGGLPCRHCLDEIRKGDPFLILSYRPFQTPQPYAEQGPIFLHADMCKRHADGDTLPAMFHDWEHILIRGYGANDRICYGSGQSVKPAEMVKAAERLFANSEIAYIHARSATNNCFQFRIERA